MIAPAEEVAGGGDPTLLIGAVLVAVGMALLPLALAITNRLVPEREPPRVTWQAAHVLLLFLGGFVLLAVAHLALPENDVLSGLQRVVLVLGSVAVAAVILVMRLQPDEGVSAMGIESEDNSTSIIAGVSTYVLLLPLVLGLSLLWPVVGRLMGFEIGPQAVLEGILRIERSDLFYAVSIAVLVGPMCEEVVFRGFLQPLLVARLGPWTGVVSTSFLFAVLHGVTPFLPLFVLSLILGWVKLRTQRLVASWAVHALHNALTLGLAFRFPEWWDVARS